MLPLSNLSTLLLGNLSSFLNLMFALQNHDAKVQVCGIVTPHLQGLADRHLPTSSCICYPLVLMLMMMVMVSGGNDEH